jgi:hypothetical protein
MRFLPPLLGTLLVGILVDGALAAGAGAPLIDPQTPPACSPDGYCYPKRETWGYYQGRWRRWPGDLASQAETELGPEELMRPDLRPYVTPLPTEEDLASPPPTQRPPVIPPIAPPSEEGAPAGPTATPPTTGVPPQSLPPLDFDAPPEQDSPPSMPFELPQLPDPSEPSSDTSTPETSPFSTPQNTGDDLFDLQSFEEQQQTLDESQRRASHQANDDPPPTLPVLSDRGEQLGYYSTPGSAQVGTWPSTAAVEPHVRPQRSFDPGVVPAGYVTPSSPQQRMRPIERQPARLEGESDAAPSMKEEDRPAPFFSWSKLFKQR